MNAGLSRVASSFENRYRNFSARSPAVPFAIRDPDGNESVIGDQPPRFTLSAGNSRGMSALGTLDSLVITEAYLTGAVDIEGDIEAALSVTTSHSRMELPASSSSPLTLSRHNQATEFSMSAADGVHSPNTQEERTST